MNKFFLNFILVFTLLLGTSVFSQSIPSSLGTRLCGNCTPNTNWIKVKGTPDVSNRNTAASSTTAGGGNGWIGAPLPLPPNGDQFWITIRDLGSETDEEIIGTTITGLVVGKEYEVLVYSLTARANVYSPTYNDSFDFQLQGGSRITVVPTRNTWGINRLRFTATAVTRTINFYPGYNASTSSFQSVNISVTANAINEIPVAVNDNAVTELNTPVSLNVTTNDYDIDGAIVVSTVDLDPSTPGIQNTITTSQGIWMVNNLGVVTFTPATGFYGMATIPYTIQDNCTLDGMSVPGTSSPANINILVQVPFANCSSSMYLTQYPAAGGTSLYTLDNVGNPLVITKIGATSATSIKLNGVGYHPNDNFIYGINTVNNHMYRMDANATQFDLGEVANLPVGDYISGDIDDLGNYYVKANVGTNGGTSLYKINISTKIATLITLNQPITTADFAYNKTDGLLYGVNQNAGVNVNKLYRINPANGVVLFSTQGSGVGSDFGAMYTDGITGAVYGNSNGEQSFYRFNKITGVATKVSGSISALGNDGAHCVNAGIQFGVDLGVTKTDGKTTYISGTTNEYKVIVSNAGPFTALSAVVTDLVPTGIPAANVTYTAVASAGSDTSVVGIQTGAINDIVNIQSGGNVTYTINIDIPTTFYGSLVNTATVAASVDNVEVNLLNNSATDTDTESVCYNSPAAGAGVSTNHGITLLQRSSATAADWPMIRKSAHTVLESNTKGFVITRMTTAQITAIVSPQEGMMVFDTDLKCLKINSNGTVGGWSCFSIPTCP